MDITFDTENVSVSVQNSSEVSVTAENVDLATVLENLSASDILKHMDADAFLEEIGGEEVVNWATDNGHIEED